MNSHREIAVIIVAAGRGARAGVRDGPKQYRELGSKTVIQHTIEAFIDHSAIDWVICVTHPNDDELYSHCAINNGKLLNPVHGGTTRQDSVYRGLQDLTKQVPSAAITDILIHDAARPFISANAIDSVLDGLRVHPAVLPATPIVDTVKRGGSDGLVLETVSRDGLFAAQTPQGFHFELIRAAHEKAQRANEHNFTDDSALVEWFGHSVHLVAGDLANTKLTTQDDIARAQKQMKTELPDVRVGHGYDTHRLVPGKSIRLCGVDLPFDKTLFGHSDADVGLHALTDALLGAIADGDIGSHFPPSDPKWAGANSDQFLEHAVSLVKAAGGTITHCDVTLVCEAPKIGPHRASMRAAMAPLLGIDVSRVSVKATTNERIGFVGREEGMVAFATATVVMAST